MMLNTFFNNFELLADVPNGMQKLRELILQLAIQGKLGTQNPKDESSAVLLEKIRAKTDKLIKEKKIKKIKSLPPIEANEIPYEKPGHWAWSRLSEIIQISSGNFLPSHKMAENGHIPVFGGNGITGYHDQYNITKPTLVIGRVGFYCGSVHITPELAWITDNAFSTYFSESHINLKFLYWLLKGTDISIRDNSTAQPVISGRKIYPIIVGLPPYEEQKRIVAKVDQLMALCDELEACQQKKHERRIHLNNAALDKLLTAPTPEEFAQHWQRICDNFDLLYDAPETVGQLRQAILQLAVQGKLVAQDEGDEPAAVLLEKIRVEREKLVKKKQIKKVLFYLLDNEIIPYKLPKSWVWTNLANVGIINPRNTSEDKKEVSFIPMTLISEYYKKQIKSEKRQWGEIKKGFTHFAENDVVMAKITPCFQNGKSAVMHNLINGLGAGTTELHVFRPLLDNSVNPEYILLYLKSPQFLKEGIEKMTGTAGHKRVPKEYFAGNPFPLPPYNEQKHIVAKVDLLMALCDELEAGLVQAQTEGGELMEAVVHHVLAG